MTLDLKELRRVAGEATPGPWEAADTVVWREESVPVSFPICCGNDLPSGECCGNAVEGCEWERVQSEIANAGTNDCAFIAAANPATVIALLDEIDRLTRAVQYEQHRTERIGTHGPGCWKWGPQHYECAVEEVGRLRSIASKLSAAISWLDYPFIDNNTAEDELRSRVGFMMKDAEQPRQALASTGGQDE